MPLVVLSLTGDASDVFDWTHSVSPGGAQDLSELLQMLREHYCGSFTFWEQRNMVKNLCQGAREDATDFMIRVGSSVGNLVKDWKGQITEAELKSLQYEVSLNGVREEIRHVLDSEIARHGQLTPHQMYEVVKKYETYVAHNKCLEGKSTSPHVGHQRAAAQTSGYRPCCNLQIKMAHSMQAQEKRNRKCFICQSGDHLMKDHYKGKNRTGPLQPKGPPQSKSAHEMAKASPHG